MSERTITSPDPCEPFLLSQSVRLGGLRRALRAGGANLADVVKVTTFLTDRGDFSGIADLCRKFFAPPCLADSIIEAKGLCSPDAMIEAGAIAAAGGSGRSA